MKRTLLMGLLAASMLAAAALADDKAKAAAPIDAKTAEVMKKIGVLYKDAKSLHTEATVDTTIGGDGAKREFKVTTTVDMKRPNLFALRTTVNKNANSGLDIVSDGKNFVVFNKRGNQYTEKKAPAVMSGVGKAFLDLELGHDATGMLFQNVLADDPAEALLDGVTKGEHVGMEKVGDKNTHHLKFKQDGLDWEIWVASEGEPFILKAVNVANTRGGKATTVETYTNWKLNTDPEKDPFKFTAPEGAKKVDHLGGAQKGG